MPPHLPRLGATATAPSPRTLRPAERNLLGVAAFFMVLALVLPPIAQPPAYHAFADTRAFLGVPNAADVLSNGAFLLCGLAGLLAAATGRSRFASAGQRDALLVAYAGLAVTALGSGYYHWAPSDATLAWDRYGMVVAFAGIGAAVAARAGDRAARGWIVAALVGGVASVWWWERSGNLTPYAVVQFGGLLLAIGLVFALRPQLRPEPRFLGVLGAYIVAKLFEHWDADLFAITGGLVAGHPLKHLIAGLGSLWLVTPLLGPRGWRAA